jgi:uncharacterized membrane protein YphA (DoxX/SURF4 family)
VACHRADPGHQRRAIEVNIGAALSTSVRRYRCGAIGAALSTSVRRHRCGAIIGSQLWIGGLLELLGGAAILLGYRTRLAAFLCSGEMAVAYMQFHWKGHFGRGFFPALNHGELAALYCFVFLFVATQGSGKWALDRSSK